MLFMFFFFSFPSAIKKPTHNRMRIFKLKIKKIIKDNNNTIHWDKIEPRNGVRFCNNYSKNLKSGQRAGIQLKYVASTYCSLNF